MKKIKVYKTIPDFLNENEAPLLEHELANNLILGLCHETHLSQTEKQAYSFVSLWDDKRWISSSLKSNDRLFISGKTKEKEDLKFLAEHYKQLGSRISGVLGETFYAESFASYYNKKVLSEKKLLAHQLSKINKITLSDGKFELAIEKDRDVLSEYLFQFQEELGSLPKRSRDDLYQLSKTWIDKENLFVWKEKEEIMSMAAIVRRCTNLMMIGYVYTPEYNRGKGYASSCVEKLSEFILKSGYKHCGLFTEKTNITSNKIYKNIGYEVISEFSEIEFS